MSARNAVGMTDFVALEFIPEKSGNGNSFQRNQGMEFIPEKSGNGIHSREIL
jgi:hypothetical protein